MALLERIELRLASLERTTSGVLIIRFRPETLLDQEGVSEVIKARAQATVEKGGVVMVVLQEGNHSDIQVNITDHGEQVAKTTIAEAIVAQTPALLRLADLYYTHHAQPFPTAIFDNENSAIEWLEGFISDADKR